MTVIVDKDQEKAHQTEIPTPKTEVEKKQLNSQSGTCTMKAYRKPSHSEQLFSQLVATQLHETIIVLLELLNCLIA